MALLIGLSCFFVWIGFPLSLVMANPWLLLGAISDFKKERCGTEVGVENKPRWAPAVGLGPSETGCLSTSGFLDVLLGVNVFLGDILVTI